MKHFLTAFLLLFVVATSFAQTPPAPLVAALTETFQKPAFLEDGWVFYPEKAFIKQIEQPAVAKALPNMTFHQVTMTNHLGYHVNQGTGVVLFDSVKNTVEFVAPLWYGGISDVLLDHIEKQRFATREELLDFLQGIHALAEVGSSYTFVLADSADELIIYDLVYSTGDSYTTGGPGITSTVHYTEDGIWRSIEVHVHDNKIQDYKEVNPWSEENRKKQSGQPIK